MASDAKARDDSPDYLALDTELCRTLSAHPERSVDEASKRGPVAPMGASPAKATEEDPDNDPERLWRATSRAESQASGVSEGSSRRRAHYPPPLTLVKPWHPSQCCIASEAQAAGSRPKDPVCTPPFFSPAASHSALYPPPALLCLAAPLMVHIAHVEMDASKPLCLFLSPSSPLSDSPPPWTQVKLPEFPSARRPPCEFTTNPAFVASANGDVDQLKVLHQQFPNSFQSRLNWGWTAAHLAAACGQDNVLLYMYAQDPECLLVKNDAGQNPLHYAAANGQLYATRILVKRVPELVSWTCNDGRTPVEMAKAGKCRRLLEYVERLIEQKRMNEEGERPHYIFSPGSLHPESPSALNHPGVFPAWSEACLFLACAAKKASVMTCFTPVLLKCFGIKVSKQPSAARRPNIAQGVDKHVFQSHAKETASGMASGVACVENPMEMLQILEASDVDSSVNEHHHTARHVVPTVTRGRLPTVTDIV